MHSTGITVTAGYRSANELSERNLMHDKAYRKILRSRISSREYIRGNLSVTISSQFLSVARGDIIVFGHERDSVSIRYFISQSFAV